MLEPRIAPKLPDWMKEHLTRYLATDGKDGHLWDASIGGGEGMVPTLLLSTTGRKSGRVLTLPLIYGTHDASYVVVASKGGAPTHPVWYLNLAADPLVTVQIEGRRFDARARTAEGDERARLWTKMVGIYAPYLKYQEATQRDIPVVVLDPV